MFIKIKPGVKLLGLSPQVSLGIQLAASVYEANGMSEMVITSITDGKHGRKSKHNIGHAFDLRTHNIKDPDILMNILGHLIKAFGKEWDVLLRDEGKANEHFHLEWDPK